MEIFFGISVAVLVGLSAVLFTVYRLRPEVFKVNLGVTRLVNLKIEMRSPRPPNQQDRPSKSPPRSRIDLTHRSSADDRDDGRADVMPG